MKKHIEKIYMINTMISFYKCDVACSAAFDVGFIVRMVIDLLVLVRHHLNLNQKTGQMCGWCF